MKIIVINLFFLIFLAQNVQAGDFALVSTTAMVEDIVKNVKPDSITSTSLIGSGVDPHLFKPTRTDMTKLLDAEIIFLNGNHLEGKMIDPIKKLSLSGKSVEFVTEKLPKEKLIQSAAFEGNFDPHIWMDPVLWAEVAGQVRSILLNKYPEKTAEIDVKYEAYTKELKRLDAYIVESLKTIPETSRVLITAHDAFGYFGKRYGLEVLGIQGISTESEASVHDIEKLVSIIVNRKIKAVFVESTISEKNIKALLEGARARGQEVAIGGQLYSDAMGKLGTYTGTYVGMIDHNVTTIVNALGGSAPTKGMSGNL